MHAAKFMRQSPAIKDIKISKINLEIINKFSGSEATETLIFKGGLLLFRCLSFYKLMKMLEPVKFQNGKL